MLLLWVVIESHTQSKTYLRAHFWVFMLCDTVVTSFVLIEIGVAVVAQGWRRYCRRTSHVLDIVVAVLCIFVLLLHAIGPSVTAELGQVANVDSSDLQQKLVVEEIEQEEVETSVLVMRYVAQISRLYVMLRHFKRFATAQLCLRCRNLSARLRLLAHLLGSLAPTPRTVAASSVSQFTVLLVRIHARRQQRSCMHQQQVELDLDLEKEGSDGAASDGAASMEGDDESPRGVHSVAGLASAADAEAMDRRDGHRGDGQDAGNEREPGADGDGDATAGDSDRADEEVEELTGEAERKAAEGSPRL